jgi:glycine dehydrogenase subunit 1
VPYVPNTDCDREEMLREIGVSSVDDLFSDVPRELRASCELTVPGPLSELELVRHMQGLAAMNRSPGAAISFLGGGVYDHAIPSAVHHVTGLPHFYTAYTPYQAEASQGTLQSIYEFQSLMTRLTGMDVANASMYDGASAAAEACLMALGITRKNKVLMSSTVNPAIREVARTYMSAIGVELLELPSENGVTDVGALEGKLEDAAAVLVQHPNFFGLLEPVAEIGTRVRESGALLVASVDPISLALLKPPSEYGASIVVGEAQSLGAPVAYGGPLLGFMATERKHVRRLPGRIIGRALDGAGRRGYVMTLQTREQHIRREKATSNICTNQGLVALGATVYLSLLGKTGFVELASQLASKAAYAARELAKVRGVSLMFDRPFFREFVVRLPFPAPRAKRELGQAGIWPGINCGCYYDDLKDCMLVSVSEKHSREDIDSLASALEAIIVQGAAA